MNNNSDSGTAAGMAAIGLGMIIMAVVIYVIAIILSLVMTIVAMAGWTRDLSFGSLTIRKEHCRAFIPMGVAGEIVMALLITWLQRSGIAIDPDFITPMIAGGYAGFSLGGLALLEWLDEQNGMRHENPPAPLLSFDTPPADAQREARSFPFASWDDEARP